MAKKAKAKAARGKKSTAKKSARKRRARREARTNLGGATAPLRPPPDGAVVRMYRIGHGDCFLIAFSGENPEKPAFVLIDCGYKPGSPSMLEQPTTVADIGRDILEATGGFVDVAVVTHEHQDHVNGFTPANFPDLKVGEVWFAWTENPRDDIANQLRKKFHDRLLGLLDARANLMGLGKQDDVANLDWLLEFELGEAADQFSGLQHAAAGKNAANSANKVAMKFLKDCAPGDPEYLYPHTEVRRIPGAKSARVFVLGPPRDIDKIDDLDPVGKEEFGERFAAAGAGSTGSPSKGAPFAGRHAISLDQVFSDSESGAFFEQYYGQSDIADPGDGKEIPSNAIWRRMTIDDAADAGALALAMNNATNNASLVLAFELKGGKVLLFVGDAQAGNWRSWSDGSFVDGGVTTSAEDLLARTVLYKVGHHGSHNATLKGKAAPGRASLAGMALGSRAAEFVALITAVEAWAHQKPKPNWNHPLPAIKQALLQKAGGRVLQTDSELPSNPVGAGAASWRAFVDRVKETSLYFDVVIDA